MRWTALILVALTMFFGYMFVDLMSPLQSMIEAQRGWTPDVFGMYGSSEFIFNVFGFLILAGIILDRPTSLSRSWTSNSTDKPRQTPR